MTANYAEIGRVGELEAGFKFSNFFLNIVMKHKKLKISKKINKKIKIICPLKLPKYHFTVATA